MAYSTLHRKTPLKAKTSLKARTSLKACTRLSSNKSLSGSHINRTNKQRTVKRKTYTYKPKYKYESIFGDFDTCYITGAKKPYAAIHVHHVFGSANKTNSEKYHFLIALRADWHDLADYGIHQNRELDLKIKRMCQDYWLKYYGTKEEFIAVFGRWW